MAEAQASQLFGGYDEEFVNAVEDELQCAICQLPLKEPLLTKCGHRFCRQCLDEHFRRLEQDRQQFRCPVDRNVLVRDKDTFADKATERKILSFIIKCLSNGCQWTGELRSKDNHLASCPLKVVSCTNKNCHVTLTRNKLQEHVTTTCPWMILKCNHCSASHPACKTKIHQSECRRFPCNCPKSCGAVIPREEELEQDISKVLAKFQRVSYVRCEEFRTQSQISLHTERDCPLTLISCPYSQMGCTVKVQRRETERHLETATRLHLDLACLKLHKTEEELHVTQKNLDVTKKNLDVTQKDLDVTQKNLDVTQKEFKYTTCKLEERVNALESASLHRLEVNTWKVTGFSEILRLAESGQTHPIESPPFYNCGYKFMLLLFPSYSHNCDLGTPHVFWRQPPQWVPLPPPGLKVFFKIMKGEYDAILPWPFHKAVTFTVIDQQENPNNRNNIVKSFTTNARPEFWECYARPETNGNKVHIINFLNMPQHTLLDRRYLVDDTLFIQVQVTPPK